MELTEKEKEGIVIYGFLYLLDEKASLEFNKRVKESGLNHEKRSRMRQVLFNSIANYEKRIEENNELINELLAKYDFLHETLKDWQEGYISLNAVKDALKREGKL